MAINKKLIHFKKKEDFDNEVANKNILDHSIVFIQDSKEISTHGTVYKSVNWSILESPWKNIANGVYAVSSDGKPVEVSNADESCIGVALVAGEHKFMIAKNNATDGGLYWMRNYRGLPNYGDLSITNYTTVDGMVNSGYLPMPDGTYHSTPNLSGDYTTWTDGAWSDFNGKANTDVIVESYATSGIEMDDQDMCKVLKTYNEGGYTDWYVPALGQLALMSLSIDKINVALNAIGGTDFTYGWIWSSTEYSGSYVWAVGLGDGHLYCDGNYHDFGKESDYNCVRFIRDIN